MGSDDEETGGRFVNGTIVSSLVLYYVVVLGIGVWVMRKGARKNLEGYLWAVARWDRWSPR